MMSFEELDRTLKKAASFGGAGAGEVRLMNVIETKLLRKGAGTEADPVRRITQYWSTGGELLAEVDPYVTNISQS